VEKAMDQMICNFTVSPFSVCQKLHLLFGRPDKRCQPQFQGPTCTAIRHGWVFDVSNLLYYIAGNHTAIEHHPRCDFLLRAA
jgi:hypothetical protein